MTSGVGAVETPQQDLASLNLEDVLQQSIDVERFEAVPEHDGNLQRLIERYGDNPGSCPYIKSMGEAGVQLVQKLAEAEKNPDRGPTIRELMEVKKKEVQSQTTVTKNSNPAKNTETAVATKTDNSRVDKKPVEAIEPNKTVERVLAQEHVARIMSKAVEEPTNPNTKSRVEPEEPRVKLVEESLPDLVAAEAEAILRQQTFDIDARRIGEIEQSHNQTLPGAETVADTKVSKAQEVERSAKIEDISHLETRIDPVTKLVKKELKSKPADDITNYAETDEEVKDTTFELESTAVEDSSFDIDEIVIELGLEYPEPDVDDVLEEPGIMSEIDIDYSVNEDLELDIETFSEEVSSDLAPDIAVRSREPTVKLAETTAEAEEPIDLRTELNVYIETLEPDKAGAAKTALESLVKVLRESDERKDNRAESSAIEVREIEHLFVELLEALNLDYETETVKKLAQALFTPELLADITEEYALSIDRLNYLGTREYKPTSITSMFSQLLQLIKQKVQPYLQLGKYALAVSNNY